MAGLKPFYKAGQREAGADEAGRGCLAGPVVAAAVILPEGFNHPLLNDSKQLNVKEREEAVAIIKENALAHATGICNNLLIDEVNILKASFRAMNIAVRALSPQPEFLLIDGNRFYPETEIPFHCFVKGDATYLSIAAASILAKTTRDDIMEELHHEYPRYNWVRNKGYPTAEHRKAILEHGISPYHRKSFRLLNNEEQMRISF